ncbi:hypothetical protein RCO27_12215 [Sphingosinicella sp. LHD-64]|uniref:hypothetical protein n=1 Tax=Sphingosinicella sp. LHD-64 TaxID=3072139 RepID=UPI00280E7542|nr:hypothetical protein [Sphingosinicella sp. LHD-64]MDQ8756993.1 hypothetical protein [Sphingosinicella sp. LHD-64]
MKALIAIAAAGLAGTVAFAAGVHRDADPERRLATALEGRVAEPPVACVMSRQLRGNTPIDESTILFQGIGGRVYVNRTRNACAGLRSWHALRSRRLGTSLCEGDLVVAFDPTSGVERGGCTLGEFEPYRRAS